MQAIKTIIFAAFMAALLVHTAYAEEENKKMMMVDDFDRKIMFNLVDGKTQGYEEAGVKCIPTFTDDPKERYGESGASLRLDFDVSKGNAFAYYWTALLVGKQTQIEGQTIEIASVPDLRGYDYLEFMYKDPQGGVEFTIELHEDSDGDGKYIMGVDRVSSVNVGPFIDKLAVGKWQKISIPSTSFSNVRDWSRLLDIVFVFKSGRGVTKGTIYLDNLAFVKVLIL